MKAIWKGSISFALISIPVKLYSAVKKRIIPLHLLHKKCSAPLKYERYCQRCNMDVEWEDVVHGYEYEKGKFVVLNDEELHSIYRGGTRTINILRFIDAAEVAPLLYEGAFYLEPDPGGERAYILLREILRTVKKVALVRVVLRDREHIGILRVFKNAMVLQTLHYIDEVLMPDFLKIPEDVRLNRKEYKLAGELVRRFTGRFDASEFHDETRKALMELIETKIEGGEVRITPEKEVRKVISLMDALKRSLEEKPGRRRVKRRVTK